MSALPVFKCATCGIRSVASHAHTKWDPDLGDYVTCGPMVPDPKPETLYPKGAPPRLPSEKP